MFERFTESARKVIVLAKDEASRYDHPHIGTEHLLIGLIREEEGIAAQTLDSVNVTLESARLWVSELVGWGLHTSVGRNIPFTPKAKKAFQMALREALQLGHSYIGTEHILLGLVRVEDGVGYRIITKHGTGADAIRREVVRLLQGGRARSRGGRKLAEFTAAVPDVNNRRANRSLMMYNVVDRAPLRITARVHTDTRVHGERNIGKRVIVNIMWGSNRYGKVDVRLPKISWDFSHWHKSKYNKQPSGGWQPSNSGIKKLYDAGLHKFRNSA